MDLASDRLSSSTGRYLQVFTRVRAGCLQTVRVQEYDARDLLATANSKGSRRPRRDAESVARIHLGNGRTTQHTDWKVQRRVVTGGERHQEVAAWHGDGPAKPPLDRSFSVGKEHVLPPTIGV